MRAIITKASDDSYYEFRDVNTMEELLDIYKDVVVMRRPSDSDLDYHWLHLSEEETRMLNEEVQCEITIYDGYIE